ncbi:MAG: glycosyltransferase family 4 protein [Candidatus Pacebacteria bacterium]|nr:glycosyltransferase family 4 protein [Candidatus Paceibacterota bacterium]
MGKLPVKNLLFITQKMDKNDDLLGVYHEWIKQFAGEFDFVSVICLEKGEYDLLPNVKVFSLGKESGRSRLKYIVNFYKYIWSLRNNYDAVLVHMNKEYVILGWKFWRLSGKKIFLWHNHAKGGFFVRLAVVLSDKVFYTSSDSFTARFKKSRKMPAGLDTEKFKPSGFEPHSSGFKILSLGRISPVKKTEVLIKAAEILDKRGGDFILDIAGSAPERDVLYFNKIKKEAAVLEQKGKLKFLGSVKNSVASDLYGNHDVFVNLTPAGSFDKTVIEAALCGTLVLACNKAFEPLLTEEFLFKEGDSADLAEKLQNVFELIRSNPGRAEKIKKRMRAGAAENHGLDILIKKLIGNFNE